MIRNAVNRVALKAAVRQAREAFPNAADVRPVWYDGRAMAEVWTDRTHARIFDPESAR